ncbi:MAG: hypothetical protein ABI131_04430, partial [Nostocoides sp.]
MFIAAASGCSSSAETPKNPGPYAQEIRDAQASATSDFEKDVLTDGVVSRSEYEEAVKRQVACMNARGFDTTAELQASTGFYQFRTTEQDDPATEIVEGEDSGAPMISCQAGNTQLVAALYTEMMRNPAKIDESELLRACLVRRGLIDKTMTAEQVRENESKTWEGTSMNTEDPGFF